MERIKTRCWEVQATCACGDNVIVYLTVPDYGDAFHLFTCLRCGAVFAVDPEREAYSDLPFGDLKRRLNCPGCGTLMTGVVPYPDNFRCLVCCFSNEFT
jgi:uncharacterized C2H2 Zn-finger protein